MAMAALLPLAIGCAIDLTKFGVLFGIPYSEELLIHYSPLGHVNGGHFLDLRYVPSTLQAYVAPTDFRVSSIFPYITLPNVPSAVSNNHRLFWHSPTASVVLSMPLLVVSGVVGVITAFTPRRPMVFNGLRILLVTAAIPAGVIMIFGWILERYVADFMPLLVLASMIGMVEVWHRLDGRYRATRVYACVVIAVLALFGLLTNLGLAITPNQNWNRTQLTRYVDAQRMFSDVTGHPLDHYVVVGSNFPSRAPMGTLFVKGQCAELYIADQTPPLGFLHYVPNFWLLVEQAPRTPICHSLVTQSQPRPPGRGDAS